MKSGSIAQVLIIFTREIWQRKFNFNWLALKFLPTSQVVAVVLYNKQMTWNKMALCLIIRHVCCDTTLVAVQKLPHCYLVLIQEQACMCLLRSTNGCEAIASAVWREWVCLCRSFWVSVLPMCNGVTVMAEIQTHPKSHWPLYHCLWMLIWDFIMLCAEREQIVHRTIRKTHPKPIHFIVGTIILGIIAIEITVCPAIFPHALFMRVTQEDTALHLGSITGLYLAPKRLFYWMWLLICERYASVRQALISLWLILPLLLLSLLSLTHRISASDFSALSPIT